MAERKFYSHVICSGTKINFKVLFYLFMFYSHVICSGTKIGLRGGIGAVRVLQSRNLFRY